MSARKKRKGLAVETRPSASASEVQAALLNGTFTSLILDKRISIEIAEGVATMMRAFLRLESGQEDERLKPLEAYLERERARVLTGDQLWRPPQVGQTRRYPLRTTASKSKDPSRYRRAFIQIPVGLYDDGTLEAIDVKFEADGFTGKLVRRTR